MSTEWTYAFDLKFELCLWVKVHQHKSNNFHFFTSFHSFSMGYLRHLSYELRHKRTEKQQCLVLDVITNTYISKDLWLYSM